MAADTPGKTGSTSRLLFIDNLRIFLICLVITTHSAITYGGVGSWYFFDTANSGPVTSYVLSVIDILNQSFFMGFFVLVSAYFVPGSLSRKGVRKFAHDRLIRLGIPLVFWLIFMNPILNAIVMFGKGEPVTSIPEFFAGVSAFSSPWGPSFGPMWFVAFLLVATFVFLLWEYLVPPKPASEQKPVGFPGIPALLGLGVILAAVTFLVRIVQPIGTSIFFGFQLPFFPQYIAFFVIGIIAARNRWLDAIPERVGKIATCIALILTIILPFIAWTVMNTPDGLMMVRGGLHWQAFGFALWEQMEGVFMTIALLWIFAKWFNHQGTTVKEMAGDSYTVYIIHPVFIVSLAVLLLNVALPGMAKFLIELPLAICLSFLAAHLIRKIPGIQKVL